MTEQNFRQIKAVPMAEYLAYRGYLPVRRQGDKLLYHSPFRHESTPSFWVSEGLNRFKDFGDTGKGDDLIMLIRRLDHCSFLQAVAELTRYCNFPARTSFSFIGQTNQPGPQLTDEIKAVKLLENKTLIRYTESRRISFPIARRYLREVYYTYKQKPLFALGFGNDQGGYELRTKIGSKDVKRCIGRKAITTISGTTAAPKAINLFEGFFDFLSAMCYYKVTQPTHQTIILNSTTLLDEALPILQKCGRVNTFLDRDAGGERVLERMSGLDLQLNDQSDIYSGFKDFNDFWKEKSNAC